MLYYYIFIIIEYIDEVTIILSNPNTTLLLFTKILKWCLTHFIKIRKNCVHFVKSCF